MMFPKGNPKGKRGCKTFINRQERENYKINADNEKNKLREEFLEGLKKENVGNDDWIKKIFIKEEEIENRKNLGYKFIEIPEPLKSTIKLNHKEDSKYIRDLFYVEKDRRGAIRFIV